MPDLIKVNYYYHYRWSSIFQKQTRIKLPLSSQFLKFINHTIQDTLQKSFESTVTQCIHEDAGSELRKHWWGCDSVLICIGRRLSCTPKSGWVEYLKLVEFLQFNSIHWKKSNPLSAENRVVIKIQTSEISIFGLYFQKLVRRPSPDRHRTWFLTMLLTRTLTIAQYCSFLKFSIAP